MSKKYDAYDEVQSTVNNFNRNFDENARNLRLGEIAKAQQDANYNAVKMAYIQEDDPYKKAALKEMFDEYELEKERQKRWAIIFVIVFSIFLIGFGIYCFI